MKLPQLHLVVQDRAAEIPLHYLHGVLPMSMFAASQLMHPMGAGLQLKVEESLLVYMFAAFASIGSSWTLHVYTPQKLKSISPIFHNEYPSVALSPALSHARMAGCARIRMQATMVLMHMLATAFAGGSFMLI